MILNVQKIILPLYIFLISEFEEEEVKVLTKLKETVDKQRDDLRAIKRELQQKTVDCEAVCREITCNMFECKVFMVIC